MVARAHHLHNRFNFTIVGKRIMVPQVKIFPSSVSGYPILGIQSPDTRALTVGYISRNNFIPCRLNLGGTRQIHTFASTVQTLRLPEIQKILLHFKPIDISTITILRETLACNLPLALYKANILSHYGDCYIGANHIKTKNSITTNYAYENVEGLNPNGLWILGDSIAEGRNLIATLTSLLSKFIPKHIIIICPIANRLGINKVAEILAKFSVPATFVVWGALFGLEPTMHYDEPWGLPDCEPIDARDQKMFVDMYASTLCVGGDFGNDYYCPPLAIKLYKKQLKEQKITPKIPTLKDLLKVYEREEFITQ
jgi:hypothetical protein